MTDKTPSAVRYAPDYAFPPGAFLEERLDELGMTQAELSRRTGLSQKHISLLTSGEAALSPQTALLLEKVTGMPASLWNRLEANYRTWQSQATEEQALEQATSWASAFPLKEMAERQLIPSGLQGAALVKSLLQYFGVGSVDAWHEVYDKVAAAQYRPAEGHGKTAEAIAAWLRAAELRASELSCRPFDRRRFLEFLPHIRELSSLEPSEWWPALVRSCADVGVAVVVVPEFKRVTQINGASWWHTPRKAIIALSGRRKTADGFFFTFTHEACHILRHSKKVTFVSDDTIELVDPDLEIEADRFAREILIPQHFEPIVRGIRGNSLEQVKSAAREIGIHPGVIVGRLQYYEKRMPPRVGNGLKQRLDLAEDFWKSP
jgi:HTH-type transcriptional regulator/antitoxin HigA